MHLGRFLVVDEVDVNNLDVLEQDSDVAAEHVAQICATWTSNISAADLSNVHHVGTLDQFRIVAGVRMYSSSYTKPLLL
jgi:hypothetical protein